MLQNVASANQRYSYVVPRYHGHGHRWMGQLTGPVTLFSDRTQFTEIHT